MIWVETLLQDARYGLRQLRKAPALVATAVCSLALGIGANTAIFSMINAVMLQFLPVHDPSRLVLFFDGTSTGFDSGSMIQGDEFSSDFYEYLKQHNDSFEGLCAFQQGSERVVFHVANDASPWERAKVHLVSGNYFGVLGVNAAAGRVLEPADDKPSAAPAAVVSYPFWRDRFQLNPSVVGRVVILNGTAFTVIGVAAPEFFGERIESPPDVWAPLSFQPQVMKRESFLTARDVFWLNFMGRLKPGVSLSQARSAVDVRIRQYFREQLGTLRGERLREVESVRIHLRPGGGGISGLRLRYSQPLHVLMAVVGVVLLIACANVATLLLARAAARRSEFLARLALGASRNRVIRQVLTESILLAFVGGAIGVGFAWCGVKSLTALLRVAAVVKVRPDPIVSAFTFGLCFLTGMLFGIWPAVRLSGITLRPSDHRRWLGYSGRVGGPQILIAMQIALSLTLLIGAGLLARSLLALESQHLGFKRDHVLVIQTDASLAGYTAPELFPLFRNMGEHLSHIPEVTSAAVARFTPISGHSSSGNFSIEGYTPRAGVQMNVWDVPVGPNFFQTLGIPTLLGRTISDRDTPDTPAVAVVNQSFVNEFFPNQNPLGHHMIHGDPFRPPGAEIVGVVADSRFYDVHEPARPMVYYSLWQQPSPTIEAVLRTSANPFTIAAAVRHAFRQINPRLPILNTTSLDEQIERSLDQQRVIAILCIVFGGLALVLASVGIYGTLAYSVAGRTKEIGIRMAVGAQRRNLTWLVLRDLVILTSAGLVIGLPLGLTGTRWLKSFLFGVAPVDPVALGSALLLLMTVALVAGYLPARRAARIDPMQALRQE